MNITAQSGRISLAAFACSLALLFTHATDVKGMTPSESVSYYQDIRPIFQAHCYGCHQPAKAKGGYVMTEFSNLLNGGDSEEVSIVPEDADFSNLVVMITPIDGEAEMPKSAPPLSTAEIDLIRKWIDQGARDDTPTNARVTYDMEHPPAYSIPSIITAMDFSPDGERLAVSGYHEVLVHRADGSELVARLVGLSARIESIRFSPDGGKLAVTGGLPGRMGELQVWNVSLQRLDLSVPITFDAVYGASWSPDGKLIAIGCADATVRILNARTGEQVFYNSAPDDWALDTVFSKDGYHIVSVGRDMAAKLYEVETERFVDNITSITPGALNGGLAAVARHPLRDEVLVGGSDGTPQIYRIHRQTKRVIGDNANLIRRFPPMTGRIFGVAFSRDGERFVAGSSLNRRGFVALFSSVYDSNLPEGLQGILEKVVNAQSKEEKQQIEDFVTRDAKQLANTVFPNGIYSVAFHPSGETIAAAGADGIVHLLDSDRLATRRVFVPVPLQGQKPEDVVAISVQPSQVKLITPFDYHQLIVTGWLASGDRIDLTDKVTPDATGDLLDVSEAGVVRPKKNGLGELTLAFAGKKAVLPVQVSGLDDPFEPDYIRDVNPVIAKLGCNAGTCHGSKEGKNGFKLSLRGYDPIFDVRAFTDDLAGRRVNFAAPDDSLMLLKTTGAVPHEGGQRTKQDSDYYRIIRDWIAGGSLLDEKSPKVTRIALFPKNPVVQHTEARQQLRVVATYADGTQRDVTHEAFVQSGNTEVAAIAGAGLLSTVRRGEAPLLARYEGAYAATTLTVMGDRAGFVWKEQPANNAIDEFVAAKWKRMKILPSELCSDAEFIRRIYLDLIGLPPSPDVVRAFLADDRQNQEKRDAIIDQLVGSPEYVVYWANKWADLLQVNRKFLGQEGAKLFRDWIREQVEKNTPYNEFSYKILTASGSNRENPPASYYKILREPDAIMENTTHLFLATRFNCNKCHDHPFERWTQDQYYEMSAFFSRVGLKKDPESKDRRIGGTAVDGSTPLYEAVYDKDSGEVIHERTGQVTAPVFPYVVNYTVKQNASRRERLAAWVTSPDNRYFASSFVNRIWGYLTGTGLIEPLDDIRAGNPPTNPELLNWLTQTFMDSGFDVQDLVKLICKSRTYQLSIESHQWNEDDQINYSHAKPRRLPAEVLYDAIYTVTGAQSQIPGVPPGTRAAALPDVGVKLPDGFLNTLGRPPRESACECERSNDVQIGSVMAMVTGPTVDHAISDKNNAIAKLVEQEPDDEKVVETLYLRLLNRPASPVEIEKAEKVLGIIEPEHERLVAELAQYKQALKPILEKREQERQELIANTKEALAGYEREIAPREAELDRQQQEAVAAAEKALIAFEATLSDQLAEWEQQDGHETRWVPLSPKQLAATNGVTLERQEDGSVFASGKNEKTVYTVTADTPLAAITAIKLELLADRRLPKKGPGRAGDGNFVLTEFEVAWAPFALPDRETLLREWAFEQDFEDWKSNNQCALSLRGGVLKIDRTGKDPFFFTDVTAEKGSFILDVALQSQKPLDLQLFWGTSDQPNHAEERSTRLAIGGTGEGWAKHRVYFETKADLTSLRIDPGSEEGDVFIDAIQLRHGKVPGSRRIRLQNARADFSQRDFDVTTAIDGQTTDDKNGWASSPKLGVDRVATFEARRPFGSEAGSTLTFTLDQGYRGQQYGIGRFRLWATSSQDPIDFGAPEHIGTILDVAADQRNEDQKQTLLAWYTSQSEALSQKHDALAKAREPRPFDPKLTSLREKLARVEQPLPPDPKLTDLERAVRLSTQQLADARLTAAQDLAWAMINNPAFLFNH